MTNPNMALTQPGATAIITHETAATAVAAQAKALVEARYLVAMHRPRNWLDVRQKLLDACKRPGFADIAKWEKPVGRETITGPTIRFAEEVLRAMGNTLAESMVTYDDPEKRIVKVMVTDLEGNNTFPVDVVVSKTVERSQVRSGQEVMEIRTNSKGAKTYLVKATEDELLVKQNALVSKAMRTGAIRLLPGDILEEALKQVDVTLTTKDKADPGAAAKTIADAFAELGVSATELERYLGHPVAQCTAKTTAHLRKLYRALQGEETTWREVMASNNAGAAGASAPHPNDTLIGKIVQTPPDDPYNTSTGTEGMDSPSGMRPGRTSATASVPVDPHDDVIDDRDIVAMDAENEGTLPLNDRQAKKGRSAIQEGQ